MGDLEMPMAELQKFQYHVADEPEAAEPGPSRRGIRAAAAEEAPADSGFATDEGAARYHLSKLLEADDRPSVRGITAPERPELVPDLRLIDNEVQPETNTRLVRFEQTYARIPVFGGRAVCELDEGRGIVSAEGRLGSVEGVSPLATVNPEEAIAAVAALAGVEPDTLADVETPVLNFFQHPETGTWHLVYHLTKVPAAPAELIEGSKGHGLGSSPRSRRPRVEYLVDAHDGSVVDYFSSTPLLGPGPLPVPTEGSGLDELGAEQEFFCSQVDGEFQLNDPWRDIATYDLGLGDIDEATISDPVKGPSSDFSDTHRAGVSAHANATKVYIFFNSVLLRDGIDNKGMVLVNVVNCTYAEDSPPPGWPNAVWFDDRMWYGQLPDPSGRLVSYSRFLDVIAHELMHGVTQYTAGLVYKNQSGALNESMSDIVGIMVKNWDFSREAGGSVSTWSWELGEGLGEHGLPLRDLSDPARTGDPAHMDDYLHTSSDSGGVHTNSNIHNKAAHNVLTAKDGAGNPVFTPREVAYLYYLGLTRLSPVATFPDTRDALVAVATTMYAGDATERDAKLAAIRESYEAVGIT